MKRFSAGYFTGRTFLSSSRFFLGLVVLLASAFGSTAFAASCTLATGNDLLNLTTLCPGLASGDTITIPASAAVTLSGDATLNGVSILMGAGATLTGDGTSTLTFNGNVPNYAGAINITSGTSANPTVITKLNIVDNSTGGDATIEETTAGYVTISGSNLTRGASSTHFGIITASSTVNQITDNKFIAYYAPNGPIYTNANDSTGNNSTLQLTDNTFTNCIAPVLDYTFLQQPPNSISRNKFDGSDTQPNIIFMNSRWDGKVNYPSTPDDYAKVLADNTLFQVEDYNGQTNTTKAGSPLDYPLPVPAPPGPRVNPNTTPVPTLGAPGLLTLALLTLVLGVLAAGGMGYPHRRKR